MISRMPTLLAGARFFDWGVTSIRELSIFGLKPPTNCEFLLAFYAVSTRFVSFSSLVQMGCVVHLLFEFTSLAYGGDAPDIDLTVKNSDASPTSAYASALNTLSSGHCL